MNTKMGNKANEPYWLHWLLSHAFGPWALYYRCTRCGIGHKIAKPEEEKAELKGDQRWLCRSCGADSKALVKWVGRAADYGGGGYHELWEWKVQTELPEDLGGSVDTKFKEAVEEEVKKRLDKEFEARVKAAVEAELIGRRIN